MAATAVVSRLQAHVPVDLFDIVNGPSPGKMLQAQTKLGEGAPHVELDFTLKTAARQAAFRRKLQVANIYNVRSRHLAFTAIFSGRVVSGLYNFDARTGWFNED